MENESIYLLYLYNKRVGIYIILKLNKRVKLLVLLDLKSFFSEVMLNNVTTSILFLKSV